MKFALLGVDDEALTLTRAILDSGEQELHAIYEPGALEPQALALAPNATHSGQWESLLLEGFVDAVIVGRFAESALLRAEQLKKLAQAAVPMIIVHPACEYIDGYEIEMLRKDVGGTIVPYYPGIIQLGLCVLPSITSEQVILARRLPLRDQYAVLAQLARDAFLLRQLLGPIKSLSASGSLGEGPLSVQMSNHDAQLARWSLEPASESPEATLELIGTDGKVSAELAGMLITELSPAEFSEQNPFTVETPAREAAVLLSEFTHAIEDIRDPCVTWLDACRALEIAATVPRCLKRGKTIELFNEEHTQEGAFKGTMAVAGCLILMVLLLVTGLVAIIDGVQAGLEHTWSWRNWPVLLLAPIVFFLLLQVLGMLANRSGKAEEK
jgi:hypothetical protein